MPRAEASDPAQHDAGRDAPLFIKAQHALGYEATVHALTLTEVRAELEANFVHAYSFHCSTTVFDAYQPSAGNATAGRASSQYAATACSNFPVDSMIRHALGVI
jgi:hypothetical protein